MKQMRKEARVDVNLPISCQFHTSKNKVVRNGCIHDISLSGMKISVPMHKDSIAAYSRQLDYQIHLPDPFQPITGQGEIRWTSLNSSKTKLQFGLAFTNIDQLHQKEIRCIVDELSE